MKTLVWLLIVLAAPPPCGRTQTTPAVSPALASDSLNRDLLWQAHSGDAQKISELLQQGADPNCHIIGEEWERPLIAATRSGHDLSQAKVLLKAGADPNRADSRGWTPLMHAAHHASSGDDKSAFIGVMELLIQSGANIHTTAPSGESALSNAAEVSRERFALLLKAGAVPRFHTLYAAVVGHQPAIADQLLAMGISPRGATPEGKTLIHAIALSRFNETPHALWNRLLKLRLDVNQPDNAGHTPLHEAARRSSATQVEWLIKHGADINRKTPQGETPLQCCLRDGYWLGRAEVMSLLTTHGADINERNASGLTVLDEVLAQERWVEMDELLALGGNSGQPGPFLVELTRRLVTDPIPLSLATTAVRRIAPSVPHLAALTVDDQPLILWWSASGSPAMVKTLITAGANVNPADRRGLTPLMWARRVGNEEVAKVLTAAGAKASAEKTVPRPGSPPNWGSSDGSFTPGPPAKRTLMDAIARGDADGAKRLLQSNPAAIKTRQQGYSPLHLAVAFGRVDILPMLLAADPMSARLPTDDGVTLAQLAARSGSREMIEYLGTHGIASGSSLIAATLNEPAQALQWLLDHGTPIGR
ncbi:MAG TPA: ankyrin repeat domain-containing protein, partial [Prosthecobacter sp.]|nr:ankyrin repeat domain-containing protein [Prosthecobacter sp.]